MRRRRAMTSVAVALVALGLTLAACGGDDDEEATTSPAPAVEAPNGGGAPPGAGALPPALLECFADKGFPIESPTEIHSAPPEVVEECFGLLHQGGGTP
jgi:hypothetical protein